MALQTFNFSCQVKQFSWLDLIYLDRFYIIFKRSPDNILLSDDSNRLMWVYIIVNTR